MHKVTIKHYDKLCQLGSREEIRRQELHLRTGSLRPSAMAFAIISVLPVPLQYTTANFIKKSTPSHHITKTLSCPSPHLSDEYGYYLQVFGAICIEGPKWCGKTWTAENACKSKFMLGDPANNFQNRTLASQEPSIVLQGKAPRLIDEWQEVTSIWDAVRYEVDARQKQGQFILTGSSTPMRKGIMHSGAGRIAPLRMRTMSLWESGDSDGKISLQSLFMGKSRTQLTGEIPLRRLAQLIVRGGWPQGITVPEEKVCVLCGMTNASYQREDNVYVVPVTSLKP